MLNESYANIISAKCERQMRAREYIRVNYKTVPK